MPESKKRKKNGKVVHGGAPTRSRGDAHESNSRSTHDKVSHDDTEIRSWTDGIPPSPRWWAPAFVTFLLAGLVWVLVYYISQAQYPIPGITWWNLIIGLGSMMVGLLMLMRWR